MKAAQINNYGGPEVIFINENAPLPSLKNGQILVEIHAASINPFDAKLQSGIYQKNIPRTFPFTIGADFAGLIKEASGDIGDFKVGDEVFGQAAVVQGSSGSFAEFAATKISAVGPKPHSLSFAEAAALPLVGSSAIQAIEESINLQADQKILIHGGAGGIGSLAIQIAKVHGGHVAATASGKGLELIKELGADEVIDYKSEKFENLLANYDAVYDTVGGETTDRSFLILKPGGILVSMLGTPNEDLAKKYSVKVIGQQTQTSTAHLKRIAELVDEGKLKPIIAKTFPLDQAGEAFDYFQNGHPLGKVVVKVK